MHVFFETQDQGVVVLAMIVTGFAAGFLYDFLSLFKRGRSGLVCAVVDMVILILTGISAAVVLVVFSQSRIRYYQVLGLLLGGVVYTLLPHHFFVFLGRSIQKLQKKEKAPILRQEKPKKRRTNI